MQCVECGSSAVSERPERTIHGYRRFRCRTCGKHFNERSTGLLNRARYPSDVICLSIGAQKRRIHPSRQMLGGVHERRFESDSAVSAGATVGMHWRHRN